MVEHVARVQFWSNMNTPFFPSTHTRIRAQCPATSPGISSSATQATGFRISTLYLGLAYPVFGHTTILICRPVPRRQDSNTKALSTLIRFQTKTELFCSVFKKICVHTYRFRIVFARPHYNTVSVWKRCYTLSVHGQITRRMCISIYPLAKLKLHGSACPPFWILTI